MKEQLEIKRLAHGMDGVGYAKDGRVVFVQGALPEEVVTATVTQAKKRFMRAKVDTVDTASEHRVVPECDVFGRCGGCQCWHIAPEQEMPWKVQAAVETIERLSGVNALPDVVSHTGEMTQYRTKATLHCRLIGEERVVGFLAAGSQDVVPLNECRILHPVLWQAYLVLRDWLPWTGGRCQIEKASDTEVVLTFIKSTLPNDEIESRCQTLIDDHDFIAGVIWSYSRRRQHHIGQTQVALEDVFGMVPDSLRGARIPGGLFRQSNAEMNAVLVARVHTLVSEIAADVDHKLVVTELFAGAGNFSFALANATQKLMAFEAPGPSVEAGQQLAKVAQLPQVSFHAYDLMGKSLHREVLQALRSSHLVVLDPPRDGARLVCETLGTMDGGPDHIVYISCDPGALGRDLRILSQRWTVRVMECFDMFPRTSHMETLVVLESLK